MATLQTLSVSAPAVSIEAVLRARQSRRQVKVKPAAKPLKPKKKKESIPELVEMLNDAQARHLLEILEGITT